MIFLKIQKTTVKKVDHILEVRIQIQQTTIICDKTVKDAKEDEEIQSVRESTPKRKTHSIHHVANDM